MKRNILLALGLFLGAQLNAGQHGIHYTPSAPPAYDAPYTRFNTIPRRVASFAENAQGYWHYVRNHTSPSWTAIGACTLTATVFNNYLHDELATPAAKFFTNIACVAPTVTAFYLLGRKFCTWVNEQIGENASPTIMVTGGSVILAGLLALKNKCASLDNIAELIVGKSTDAFQAVLNRQPGNF